MNQIIKVSPGDKNYFFGFHDLVITNNDETKILALEVDDISHPPVPGQIALAGYINSDENIFVAIKETIAWNYPQGARQQWLGKDNLFIFNDKVENEWGSHIADATTDKIIQTNLFPVHCIDELTGNTFYPNYSRLHRVGGYGYVGIADLNKNEDVPKNCGIYIGNIHNNKFELFKSIYEIASCGEDTIKQPNYPHYITHLNLNPSRNRIAFLHRYRLTDGGETTRLMTIGTDGNGLRVLAKGFLSHFTWLNDDKILIWGQKSASISNIRESKIYNQRIISSAVKAAKHIFRKFAANSINRKSFLIITDTTTPFINQIDNNLLQEDGHPMLCPANNNWIVNDTYPDINGYRTLMLFNLNLNKRIYLGKFKMLDTKPNPGALGIDRYLKGIDDRIKNKFPTEQYMFTRSGLHCDLHPRWSNDGKTIYFDSIHEGSRQIYSLNVSDFVSDN
jgi:hypothetical protein